MARELTLPVWAKKVDQESNKVSILIKVLSEEAYPAMLEELGVAELDQYWLEVAYQCIKMDVQAALVGTVYDPRIARKSAELRFTNCPKYALSAYPEGRGIAAATQGREARNHYRDLRGALPF